MPPDRDFGCHARPPGVAQALHDPAGRLPPPEGPLREFHHHHFAFAGVPFAAVRLHHHVLVEAAMIGGHQRGSPGAKETADDPPVVPLQHLDHGPRIPVRQPSAAARTPDLAGDPVAVHEPRHFTGGKVYVLAAVVPFEKAVAVPVGDHPAVHQVRGTGRALVAISGADVSRRRRPARPEEVEPPHGRDPLPP